jgi:hypothetical protein
VRKLDDVFARGAAGRELVRVGLPANWEFLKAQFFAERDGDGIPDFRGSVLEALAEKPLTAEKRAALRDVLLDGRFDSRWTRAPERVGDDMHRRSAFEAVNAHAGRAVLTEQDENALKDPASSAKALAKVKRVVAEALAPPARQP